MTDLHPDRLSTKSFWLINLFALCKLSKTFGLWKTFHPDKLFDQI